MLSDPGVVGGIAIALAMQNILGDLFASRAIALDKPFEVGDAIKVNGLSGTVEQIGLNLTCLRSPDGEQIVIANADLLHNPVNNYKRLAERLVVPTFGLTYRTAVCAGRVLGLLLARHTGLLKRVGGRSGPRLVGLRQQRTNDVR